MQRKYVLISSAVISIMTEPIIRRHSSRPLNLSALLDQTVLIAGGFSHPVKFEGAAEDKKRGIFINYWSIKSLC
jgi:hypothetical protein